MGLQFNLLEVLLGSAALSFLASRYSEGSFTYYLSIIFSAGLLVHVLFWSYVYPIHISPLRHIPTVPGFPLWGQFASIVTQEVGVPQREWHKKYGPIVRYFFPFGAERLSIADNDALKHLTVHNAYNYPKPVRAKLWMMRILGEGVLLVSKPKQSSSIVASFARLKECITFELLRRKITAQTPLHFRECIMPASHYPRK